MDTPDRLPAPIYRRTWPAPVTGDYLDPVERVARSLFKFGYKRPTRSAYWDGKKLHHCTCSQHLSRSGVVYRMFLRLRQRNHGVWF